MPSAEKMPWSRWPIVPQQQLARIADRHADLPHFAGTYVPCGNGRSYSDVGLNPAGVVLETAQLDRFMSFDPVQGRLRCESGVLLDSILGLIVPAGWFLPATPGTRYVTVGGAIANDVHGKNHHVAGSFCAHVRRLALRRSDGTVTVCGPDLAPDWFAATAGGLGLTGLILWADLQLIPIRGEMMRVHTTRFRDLAEYWEASARADACWPYTVAWVDVQRSPRAGSRGILACGAHADTATVRAQRRRGFAVPFTMPLPLVTRGTTLAFNQVYFHAPRPAATQQHYEHFFYPLDAVAGWNRLHGPRGFFQYQCVLPETSARPMLTTLLDRIARSRHAASLAVLKTFGPMPPVGLLSFSRHGATLAVDFPNQGARTTRLLADLDSIVEDAGGALYPAKDSRMPARMFRSSFPRLEEFRRFVDPRASSAFWQRVSA